MTNQKSTRTRSFISLEGNYSKIKIKNERVCLTVFNWQLNQQFHFQPVAFVTFENREQAEEAKASLQVKSLYDDFIYPLSS